MLTRIASNVSVTSVVPPVSGTDNQGAAAKSESGVPAPGAKAAEPRTEADRKAELDGVVDKMNQAVQLFNHALRFDVVNHSRIVIQVVDTNTGDVIQQIPPERLVETFKSMDKLMGVLFDKKA